VTPSPPGDRSTDRPADRSVTEHDPELELAMLPIEPSLEAVLMVADQPIDPVTLAQLVNHPTAEVEAALERLRASYDDEGRGFELRRVAGGWRYTTREQYAPAVERYVLDGQQARLTQAALETLAVVAYKQPIARARVSAIRGVNVDGVMRTLVSRGLVEEAGTDEHTGAIRYATTAYFLERMGLDTLDGLPDLAPYLPESDDVDELAQQFGTGRAPVPPTAPPPGPSADPPADPPETDRD